METFLSILDWLVLLAVVFSLARAVWKGTTRSALLGAVLTAAFLLFGLVSACGASGLTSAAGVNQIALLIFLLATVLVASRTWSDTPSQ